MTRQQRNAKLKELGCRSAPMTEDEVAGLEERLQAKLPADYRAFLLEHGGAMLNSVHARAIADLPSSIGDGYVHHSWWTALAMWLIRPFARHPSVGGLFVLVVAKTGP